MFHLDSTIRLTDLVIFGGLLVAFGKVFLADQEIKRSMASMLTDHEKRISEVESRTEDHQTWLIRARLDQVSLGRRSYDRPVASEDAES